MKKIIYGLINNAIESADVYHYKESLWIIFTDKVEWVLELDKNGKLWYNYYFFENLYKYISMDVIENQHYITEWVEDSILNGVKDIRTIPFPLTSTIEDTIQNGVIGARDKKVYYKYSIRDAIQNGVIMNTSKRFALKINQVEDTIQNGIKTN